MSVCSNGRGATGLPSLSVSVQGLFRMFLIL